MRERDEGVVAVKPREQATAAQLFGEYVGVPDAGKFLGVSTDTVRRLVRRGQLKATKRYGVLLFHRRDLQALLDSGYTGRPGRQEVR